MRGRAKTFRREPKDFPMRGRVPNRSRVAPDNPQPSALNPQLSSRACIRLPFADVFPPTMLAFIVRRFLSMLAVLFCVVTITFFLVRTAPGGPFTRERKVSPQIEEQLLKRVNLNGSLWEQYATYLGIHRTPAGKFDGLLQGNLQISTKYRDRTVSGLIAQSLPVS